MSRTQYIIGRLDRRVVLVIVSLLAVLWLQFPRLLDEFQVDEDFRSFYWMNKFQDSSLFPDDQMRSDYYTSVRLLWGDVPLHRYSPGYGLLFYVASFAVTPILFSKTLPFLMMSIIAGYLFELGRSVRDSGTGTVLAVGFIFLNLASPTSLSVLPGLQRSFACLLMIAMIYYLYRQKYVAAAIVVAVSAVIYVPVFLLAVTTWGLSVLRLSEGLRRKLVIVKLRLVPLAIAVSLGVLALSPVLVPRVTDVFNGQESVNTSEQSGSIALGSFRHVWDDPQYRPGGRTPLFQNFPFIGRGGLVNKGIDALHLLILFVIGCLICLIRGRRALVLPYEVWCVLWAGLILFAMAWVAIWLTNSFFLYLPSRYTRVGLFLFLSLFVLLNGRDFVKEVVASIQRNRRRLIWFVVGVELVVWGIVLLYPSNFVIMGSFSIKWLLVPAALLLGVLSVLVIRRKPLSVPNVPRPGQTVAGRIFIGLVVIVCLTGWGAYARLISEGSFLNLSQLERELLRFLETLPKDTLLAGAPCALDNVPLFAKRQILFSCEKISKDAELTREAFDAYYADDAQVVLDFCQAHGVDYLVVDLRVYSEEYIAAGWIFFEPYNQELLPRIVDRDVFVLERVADDVKMFQSGDYFVVPCNESAIQVEGDT